MVNISTGLFSNLAFHSSYLWDFCKYFFHSHWIPTVLASIPTEISLRNPVIPVSMIPVIPIPMQSLR